jgi:hypothetical protein
LSEKVIKCILLPKHGESVLKQTVHRAIEEGVHFLGVFDAAQLLDGGSNVEEVGGSSNLYRHRPQVFAFQYQLMSLSRDVVVDELLVHQVRFPLNRVNVLVQQPQLRVLLAIAQNDVRESQTKAGYHRLLQLTRNQQNILQLGALYEIAELHN